MELSPRQEFKMKHKTFLTVLFVLVCATTMSSQQQPTASPAQQKQLSALRDLRDSGVLSPDEYQAKVQAVMAAPTPPPAAGSSALRSAEIADPGLGMTAATLQFPAGWRFAGVVARAGSCATAGGIRYSVQTPDGNTAFVKFPNYSWSWYTNPYMANGMKQRGCTVAPILSAADFLREIMIPNLRPDAQVIDIGPLAPAIQAQLDAQLKQMREGSVRMGASYGYSPEQSERISGSIVDGARAHIAYARSGQPVEEILRAVIVCNTHQQGPGFNTPPSQSALCHTQFMGLIRAPKGTLESMAPLFDKVALQINPAWDQRVAQIQNQQSQRMIDESWREHNQRMQESQAAADARTQQWKANEAIRQGQVDSAIANDRAQQNAMDRSAIETEKYALGVQTVVNPNTGQTTNVSNQYSHTVQRQSDGTIFQYNDPAFDPRQWADPTQIFTEMPTVK
jgi:hypothetical protein